MKIARKLYTSHTDDHSSKENILSRIGSGIKNTTTKAASKVKDGYNFVKTHTAKETFDEIKKGARAVGKYAKKNPDEFGVLAASYAIPWGLGIYAGAKGNKKLGSVLAATSFLPIGEGYIAGKKLIQASRNKNKKNDYKA